VPPNSQYCFGEGWLVRVHVVMVLLGRESMLAARSRTYFWGKRADAAVDYGLGRAGVRGICWFGHGERLCSDVVIV
jgi:hypothetical protein